jgi:N-acetylglucosaminyl-diphospho-decaprenol L-rhamnosyltransferase
MDVSVIVISYNTRDLLARCLEAVAATMAAPRHEVIVVDNASRDGSAAMVAERFPNIRLLRNEHNRGFAAANNQAISIARGRHVLLLNSDAFLLPGAVERMVQAMEADASVGAVCSRLLNPDGSFQGSFADFPTLRGELLLLAGLARLVCHPAYPSYPEAASQHPRAVDWVSGACMLVRRAAIEAVGLLDEEYFMYTEEVDWCYRLHLAGWRVRYEPAARVIHWSGQSAGAAPERKRAQVYRSKWLFMRKHRGAPTAAVFRACVRLLTLSKILVTWPWIAAPDPARRGRARQQLRSYGLLLGQFRREPQGGAG